jgi:diadenosine tetraphosphate (Ap4A) HIT family hydrolase
MGCPLCETGARRGSGFISELEESVVVLGENQGCPGWCVLVLKDHVEHMAELSIPRQQRVFAEVARVAAAVRAEFATSGKGGGPVRINYECLGNQVAHVHWHIIPRHADDPEPTKAVWGWSEERLKGTMTEAERDELVVRLRERLKDEPRTQ